MAEFCKECFINKLMSSKERKDYKNNKIEIIMSASYALCEGCGNITNFVDFIKNRRGKIKNERSS